MKWTRVAMAAFCLAAVPAFAQRTPVRILNPAPEQVVRGAVPITINADAVPKDGYWVVEIAPAGEAQPTFFSAIAPNAGATKAIFEWNTRANWPEKEAPPRDGQYTIRVTTYDIDNGRFVFARSNELNVYVRNRISVPASHTTDLRYRFRTDDQLDLIQKVDVTQQGVTLQSENTPLSVGITESMGSSAIVTQRVAREASVTAAGAVAPSPLGRTTFSFEWRSNGETVAGKKMARSGLSPVICPIPLPARAVRVGDSWSASFRLPSLRVGPQEALRPASANAACKLEGLEYYRGVPSAKIVADYDNAVPGGSVKGRSVAFVDYQRGELLRQEDYFSFTGTAEAAATMPGSPASASASTKYTVITAVQ